MATGLQRNKHLNRPRKNDAARRRRTKVHQKRLVALGLPVEQVSKLDTKVMRTLLRKPKKTAAFAARLKGA